VTETLVPWAPGARYMHVLCRLGVARADTSADADANPDLRTQGGSVVIDGAVRRFRYVEADGRARMISVPEMPFTIQASTGELIDAEGNVGLYLLDTSSPGVDPASFTWRARIAPTVGEAWEVVFPGAHSGDIDLAAAASITPTTGNVQLDARVAALEAGGVSAEDVQAAVDAYLTSNPVTGSGAYPVQQVALTADLAYSLPVGAPTDQVIGVVFTQDGTGGHTVTYGGDPVTVATAAGAQTLVEVWPGGEVTYPGAPGGAVDSVNGQTGVVALGAAEVGAVPLPSAIPTGYAPLADGAGGVLWSQIAIDGSLILSNDGSGGIVFTIVDVTAPSVPANLTATPTSHTAVGLAWDPSTDDTGVAGYEYRVNGGAAVDAGDVLAISVEGLTASTLYSFSVRAYDAAASRSDWCVAVEATTDAAPADVTPPTAGTLTASNLTTSGFTLTASGAADETALHATPYAFDTGGGFGAYQASPVLAVTGKATGTAYTCRHRVRDAAGNVSTGVSIIVTTTASTSILDSFDRADSATTLGSADTGQAWTAHSSTWGITGNLAYNVSAQNEVQRATVPFTSSSMAVSCQFGAAGTARYFGIEACSVNANNRYSFETNGMSSKFLALHIAGTKTVLWTEAGALPTDATVQIKVVQGDTEATWAITINGTQKATGTVTDAARPVGTRAGIWNMGAQTPGTRFNNFEVEAV